MRGLPNFHRMRLPPLWSVEILERGFSADLCSLRERASTPPSPALEHNSVITELNALLPIFGLANLLSLMASGFRHRKWRRLGVKLPDYMVDIKTLYFWHTSTALAHRRAFSWNGRVFARVMSHSGRSTLHDTFPCDIRLACDSSQPLTLRICI